MTAALTPSAVNAGHELATILLRAQEILAAADDMAGPSKADTIKSLNELLRSPLTNAALLVVVGTEFAREMRAMKAALALPQGVKP
jgi:hypothetical protein